MFIFRYMLQKRIPQRGLLATFSPLLRESHRVRSLQNLPKNRAKTPVSGPTDSNWIATNLPRHQLCILVVQDHPTFTLFEILNANLDHQFEFLKKERHRNVLSRAGYVGDHRISVGSVSLV